MSGIDVKSPVEKIMDLLESIKRSSKDKELVKDLAWAMDVISSNKLYEPILEEGISGEEKNEVIFRRKNNNSRLINGFEVMELKVFRKKGTQIGEERSFLQLRKGEDFLM